jgi:hypothetical protein
MTDAAGTGGPASEDALSLPFRSPGMCPAVTKALKNRPASVEEALRLLRTGWVVFDSAPAPQTRGGDLPNQWRHRNDTSLPALCN